MRRLLFLGVLVCLTAFIPAEYPHEISPQPVFIRPRAPMVALSFDDGPSAYTHIILDILEEHDARATFFVLGHQLVARPEVALRASELGNEIANHTWSHARLTQTSSAEIAREITRTSTAIEGLIGHSPPMFRPPFGATDERVVGVAKELGYAVVKWTADPIDWRYRDADIVYESVMRQVEDGSVVLLHDTRPTTAEAMRRLVPRLIEEGFELVTVSELLRVFYGGLEAGRVYGSYTVLE